MIAERLPLAAMGPAIGLSDRGKLLLLLAAVLGLTGLAGSAFWLGLREPLESYEQFGPTLVLAVALLVATGTAVGWRAWRRLRGDIRSAQASAERMNRFHAVMSQTNRLILRRPEPAELFKGVCEACVTAGHAELAVIDLVTGGETFRVVATFGGMERGKVTAPPQRLQESPMQQHLMKLALQSDEPVIINDTVHDARLVRWQDSCAESRINAVAVIPLKRAGGPVGVLLLCSSTKAFFHAGLVPLLSEMGADLSFALDNSDREHARRAALDQTMRGHQLFQTLFAAAPIPMAIFGLEDRKVIKVNSLWCSLVGLAPEAQIGSSFETLGCGLGAGERERFFEVLHSSHRVIGMQSQLISSGGAHHDVLVHAHMVDYLGVKSVLIVATDVSEMKAAQVADSARAVAEEANRAKTKFLAHMSHELRTPLNAMLGFAQLLSSDTDAVLSPTQTEQVRLITQAGWHLLDLVNDVMDISRIESGRLEVVSEPHDISIVLDEAMALCHPLAKAQHIDLQKRVPFGPGIGAMADPRRLRQVLLNLLSNACKYNRHGGTVRVDVTASGHEVVLEVVDNGIGMTADQLSHLFEPFNRLGHAGHAIEGTGIGLTLSRQLVEMMKGRLEVESSPETGTRARVVLPACDLVRRKSKALSSPLLPDRGLGASTVLYIEDNEVNQLVVEQMISRCKGVTLMQAENGLDGLAFAQLQQPDLILLDMQLPDMSGFDVLAALRNDPRTALLRVVAVSASAMPEDVAAAMDLGVLDYLTKPLELDSFLARIAAILGPQPPAVDGRDGT